MIIDTWDSETAAGESPSCHQREVTGRTGCGQKECAHWGGEPHDSVCEKPRGEPGKD